MNPDSLPAVIEAANETLVVQGDFDAIPRFFSPDYVAHVTRKDLPGGHTLVRSLMELYQRAFSDLRIDVEILLAGTDRVAWQRTLRATQTGPFKGFPRSGREITWRDVVTSRFENNLIVEDWVISDLAEQLLLSRKKPKN